MTKTNVLLQGEIGSGKTFSLRTLLPEYVNTDGEVRRGAGQHVALVSLESGAERTLGENMCSATHRDGIHLVYIQPLAITWDQFGQFARLLNAAPLDKALEQGDPNKRRCTQFLDLMSTLTAFTCQRCGREVGDVAELGPEWTVALDGMTGLTTVARHLCVGLKPILSRPEYNPVMSMVEGFCQLFWGSTHCNAVILSHIDREVNPTTGLSSITLHTLGQKLAPRIVKMPDEIVLAEYSEDDYIWATNVPGMILKHRSLPASAKLTPDFSQLFQQ
jgi:hypothetical protein